ncbi:MAG: SEC-C domain-containing protein [Acidobacteria bacterium]|nr:SEC-C domain-containing protein [Acidobacteriota bacterium]
MTQTTLAALSPVQAQVVLSLSTGASVSAAAESHHVGRTTIYSWFRQPAFAHALDEAKAEYTLALRDELHDASRKAIRTLTSIMDKPDAPDSVRLKAALAILNRPQSADESWKFPQPVHPLAVREAEAKLTKAAETELNTSEHLSQNSEPDYDETLVNAEIDELLNKFEQERQNSKPQPVRVEKIGRNEACPCGSGLKYKRCCLGKPQTAHAA